MKSILIALGGNAVMGDIKTQFFTAQKTFSKIVEFLKEYPEVKMVITHGNGPQVGNIILRAEIASPYIYPLPLDVCVSDSEGGMGYMFQQTLYNLLQENQIDKPVITLITQTLVSRNDSAFLNPTKPIGKFYSKEEALKLQKEKDWKMIEDSGRGYRRVVPSPEPLDIIELEAINLLINNGYYVIASGGGGIPVVKDKHGQLHGIEAVVDKDLASAIIAYKLRIEYFVILTAVDRVYINFNKPNKRPIEKINYKELKEMYLKNIFPAGSMGPKIKAMLNYLENYSEGTGIITSIDLFNEAMKGNAGTIITYN